MGYGTYAVYRNGQEIQAGYNIADVCNLDGCSVDIDRGLDHLCGATPGGDEHGCGHYFCGEHLLGGTPSLCPSCSARAELRRREDFRDELVYVVAAMGQVSSVDAFADEPDLLVRFVDGTELVLKVS